MSRSPGSRRLVITLVACSTAALSLAGCGGSSKASTVRGAQAAGGHVHQVRRRRPAPADPAAGTTGSVNICSLMPAATISQITGKQFTMTEERQHAFVRAVRLRLHEYGFPAGDQPAANRHHRQGWGGRTVRRCRCGQAGQEQPRSAAPGQRHRRQGLRRRDPSPARGALRRHADQDLRRHRDHRGPGQADHQPAALQAVTKD